MLIFISFYYVLHVITKIIYHDIDFTGQLFKYIMNLPKMNLSFNQYAKDRGEFFPFDEEKRLGLLACLFH